MKYALIAYCVMILIVTIIGVFIPAVHDFLNNAWLYIIAIFVVIAINTDWRRDG